MPSKRLFILNPLELELSVINLSSPLLERSGTADAFPTRHKKSMISIPNNCLAAWERRVTYLYVYYSCYIHNPNCFWQTRSCCCYLFLPPNLYFFSVVKINVFRINRLLSGKVDFVIHTLGTSLWHYMFHRLNNFA